MSDKGFSRRRLLQIGLGSLALSGSAVSLLAQEPKLKYTPAETPGPFYPKLKPLDQDADLTILSGQKARAQGKVIHLTGRILNTNGEPVQGAKVEIWQANTHGRYSHPSDNNQAPLDPAFQGFGVQITDEQGRFRFKTIKPGAYPATPSWLRAPHIHFDVEGKMDHLVTQMYFPGDPLNEKDLLFNGLKWNKEGAIAKVLKPTKGMEPDSLLLVWDIVLAKG
jgi:protocatechuate 3,4-dioxygenase beta subunit